MPLARSSGNVHPIEGVITQSWDAEPSSARALGGRGRGMSAFHASLFDDAVEPLGFTPAAALVLLFDSPGSAPVRTPSATMLKRLIGLFKSTAAGGIAPRRKS